MIEPAILFQYLLPVGVGLIVQTVVIARINRVHIDRLDGRINDALEHVRAAKENSDRAHGRVDMMAQMIQGRQHGQS